MPPLNLPQLGAGFVTTFLLPYIRKQILGNVDKDRKLQKAFSYKEVLTQEEIDYLVDDYFRDTGTIFETDIELRKVFWKEFLDFIKRQKDLCEYNLHKLAFRLLPDPDTGVFSKEAQDNLLKFSFHTVKAVETHLIERLIKQKEARGELSKEKAEEHGDLLKNGQLILVRHKGKGAGFDYITSKEVQDAIDNVKKQAQLMKKLFTQYTPQGELAFTFNPVLAPEPGQTERGSGLHRMQRQIWDNQKVQIEKMLEDSGLYVSGKMSVDRKGIVRGYVVDRNGERLLIEVSVAKPGKRMYRLTFAGKGSKLFGKKFFVNEDDLNTHFKNNKKSADFVYRQKQRGEPRKVLKRGPRGAAPLEVKPKGVPPSIVRKERRREEILPFAPPPKTRTLEPGIAKTAPGKRREQPAERATGEGEVVGGRAIYAGVRAAKSAFDQRLRRKDQVQGGEASRELGKVPTGERTGGYQAPRRRRKKPKSPVMRVMKYYFAGIGGALGASGIMSLFS